MKQIKERIRFIKLSLVGYGNPQTRILDVNYKKNCEVKGELNLNNCVVCLRLFQACNDQYVLNKEVNNKGAWLVEIMHFVSRKKLRDLKKLKRWESQHPIKEW